MALCSKCGAPLGEGASHCVACDGESPRAATTPARPSDNAIQLFVGERYAYYLDKWETAKVKKTRQSVNWAAFFLGIMWLSYRKMYAISVIFGSIFAFQVVIEDVFDFPELVSNVVNMMLLIGLGLYGNHWYLLHVEERVKRIRAENAQSTVAAELARQGGTSVAAAIGMVVAIVAALVVIDFILSPTVP
jgi:hypothetical protein